MAPGTFAVDEHGSDWIIQRHLIRTRGIAVAGPPPETLIDPLGPDELRRAAAATLSEWWAPQLENPARLREQDYQAYAVLTMCRVLYTLEHGAVVSKPVAARWAQQVLGRRWEGLIEWARNLRPGAGEDRMAETLDFVRFVMGKACPGEAGGRGDRGD